MQKLLTGLFLFAQLSFTQLSRAEDTPLQVVQKLFKAVSHHDSSATAALFSPDAVLFSVHSDESAPALSAVKWLERMDASKDQWLSEFGTQQQESGTVAHIWAEYDFHLSGKFSHCGIDSFSLLKTGAGWKVVLIADDASRQVARHTLCKSVRRAGE